VTRCRIGYNARRTRIGLSPFDWCNPGGFKKARSLKHPSTQASTHTMANTLSFAPDLDFLDFLAFLWTSIESIGDALSYSFSPIALILHLYAFQDYCRSLSNRVVLRISNYNGSEITQLLAALTLGFAVSMALLMVISKYCCSRSKSAAYDDDEADQIDILQEDEGQLEIEQEPDAEVCKQRPLAQAPPHPPHPRHPRHISKRSRPMGRTHNLHMPLTQQVLVPPSPLCGEPRSSLRGEPGYHHDRQASYTLDAVTKGKQSATRVRNADVQTRHAVHPARPLTGSTTTTTATTRTESLPQRVANRGAASLPCGETQSASSATVRQPSDDWWPSSMDELDAYIENHRHAIELSHRFCSKMVEDMIASRRYPDKAVQYYLDRQHARHKESQTKVAEFYNFHSQRLRSAAPPMTNRDANATSQHGKESATGVFSERPTHDADNQLKENLGVANNLHNEQQHHHYHLQDIARIPPQSAVRSPRRLRRNIFQNDSFATDGVRHSEHMFGF